MGIGTDRTSAAYAGPDWRKLFASLESEAADPLLQKFYETLPVARDTPLSDVPFAALDLETTGLNPETHGIVSIGLVPFTLERIHCARSFYRVVKPRRPLSESSVAIHHITHRELRRAPDLGEILPELLDALTGRVAVVHYRGVERPFLKRAVRERLGENLEFPLVDTMEIEARIHRGWRTHPAIRFMAGLIGRHPQSLRLAQSRARYHLPLYSAHHALTDALASAELFQAQVAHRFSARTPIGALWR
jgi:DNA polymerase III subunit epsilon